MPLCIVDIYPLKPLLFTILPCLFTLLSKV
uniref:Uncharacterized protein n=1 Tax=Nelumbo nucifera TaxID=4432 RepID=A0A822Y5Q6_NELNU|nr:TPA_asm: hypothetical protein HUJ06_027843 [Nelumbo nucifera]